MHSDKFDRDPPQTVLTVEVENITEQVREFEGHDVGFRDDDTPEFKTVDNIATMAAQKGAWLADTEGNILCPHERVIGKMER